jgi:hypothetical protein
MKDSDARKYCLSGDYLPEILKDFHDQKDLFKTIWNWWCDKIRSKLGLNWRDGHIFIIDYFLWFMALHGYKLQKIRTGKAEFYKIEESIKSHKNEEVKMLKKLLSGENK